MELPLETVALFALKLAYETEGEVRFCGTIRS
jgi:hypothetical protein